MVNGNIDYDVVGVLSLAELPDNWLKKRRDLTASFSGRLTRFTFLSKQSERREIKLAFEIKRNHNRAREKQINEKEKASTFASCHRVSFVNYMTMSVRDGRKMNLIVSLDGWVVFGCSGCMLDKCH